MLSDDLRQNTKNYHQQTETVLVGRIRKIETLDDYTRLLQLFYGYFGGLEKKIDTAINKTALPDYDERRKTVSIANDLKKLGAGVPLTAANGQLPEIKSHLQAMGAMYVIEGSTLGGKIISKMIGQKLAVGEDVLSFFNGYDDNTDHMWTSFKQALNRQAQNHTEADVVIKAANETFLQFKNWIKQHE